jgi:hypothetical protein
MMSSRIARRGAAALGLLVAILGLQLAVGVAPASADEGTTVEFTTPSPVQVAFGENWVIRAATQAVYLDGSFPGTPTLGTVDVFLTGMDEPFLTALPIQEDGSVYITQPAGKPNLPAGEYQMSAVLHASSASGLPDSHSTTPVVLTVTAYGVIAAVTADPTTLADEPVLEARLTGQFVDETGGAPGGTWTFVVSAGDETVVEAEVAQEPGAQEPLRYPITEELDQGTDYRVSSTFTPVESLAGGVEVQQPADTTFRTPDGSIGDTLGTPIPFPLWLLLVCSVLVVGLIVTAIILTVKASGAGTTAAEPRVETAPTEEFVHVEDLFPLQQAAAPPAQYPVDTPTQVMPPVQGAFTELITPSQPPPAAAPPAPPEDVPTTPREETPTENWSLTQDPDPNPDPNDLR